MALHPSFITTPVGLAIGLALTRVLKRHPKWYHYLTGGGLGGAAGYGAGEALSRLPEPSEKEEKAVGRVAPKPPAKQPELERGAVRGGMKREDVIKGRRGPSFPLAKNLKEKREQLRQEELAAESFKGKLKQAWLRDVASKFREANRQAVGGYSPEVQRGLIEYRRKGGTEPLKFLRKHPALEYEAPSVYNRIDQWMAKKLKKHPNLDVFVRGISPKALRHVPRAAGEHLLEGDAAFFDTLSKYFK